MPHSHTGILGLGKDGVPLGQCLALFKDQVRGRRHIGEYGNKLLRGLAFGLAQQIPGNHNPSLPQERHHTAGPSQISRRHSALQDLRIHITKVGCQAGLFDNLGQGLATLKLVFPVQKVEHALYLPYATPPATSKPGRAVGHRDTAERPRRFRVPHARATTRRQTCLRLCTERN